MDLDIDNICRICLNHSKTLRPLFEQDDSIENFRICDEVMFCTIVKILENDDLPSQICETCLIDLNIACRFKRLCENSDSKLRDYRNQNRNLRHQDKSVNRAKETEKEEIRDMVIKEEYIGKDEVNDNNFEFDEDDDDDEWNDDPKQEVDLGIEENEKKAMVIRNIELFQMQLKKSGGPQNMCEICGKTFRTSYDLTTHGAVHTTYRPFKCDQCPKGFIRATQLKSHMKDHLYRERKHLCTTCGKGFFTTSILKNHIRVHTKERPYKCKICGRAFIQSGGLTTHMLVHTGYKPHICDICSKACSTRSDLTVHMRTHTHESPYKCEFCFKAFKTASNLLKHRRQHLNERQFKCNICGASFNLNEGLKKHVMTHSGEKPHACETCGKCFISHSRLSKHKRVHTREQPYSCPICSKKFGYSYSRNTHMRTQHNLNDIKDSTITEEEVEVLKPSDIEEELNAQVSVSTKNC